MSYRITTYEALVPVCLLPERCCVAQTLVGCTSPKRKGRCSVADQGQTAELEAMCLELIAAPSGRRLTVVRKPGYKPDIEPW